MMIYVSIVFFFLSIIYSFYPLLRNKKWAELFLVTFIFLLGALYAMQYQIDANILPQPGDLISKLDPWANSLGKFFELNF